MAHPIQPLTRYRIAVKTSIPIRGKGSGNRGRAGSREPILPAPTVTSMPIPSPNPLATQTLFPTRPIRSPNPKSYYPTSIPEPTLPISASMILLIGL